MPIVNPNRNFKKGKKGSGKLLYERHGMKWGPEFAAWCGIKQRCLNPNNKNFHRYGGRGITVCELWVKSFVAFLEHVGPRPSLRHSIDRINNSGHYEPGNVRWAERGEQARNRDNTKWVEFNGERMPASHWDLRMGTPKGTISNRLNAGWETERAITTPYLPRKKRGRK